MFCRSIVIPLESCATLGKALELNDNSCWNPDCPIAIISKLLDLGKMVNLMVEKLKLLSDKLS